MDHATEYLPMETYNRIIKKRDYIFKRFCRPFIATNSSICENWSSESFFILFF